MSEVREARQSIAQRRALYALHRVGEHAKVREYGNYVSYVEGLPASIRLNGLGQAVAMINSQSDPGHNKLGRDLREWLCGSDPAAPYRDYPSTERHGLLLAIAEGDESTYLRAQDEALALLAWLKKIARAMLERETL